MWYQRGRVAAMPRAISATSPAKDSNVRGASEDADNNPDAADGAGADGRDREAEVAGGCMDVDGGPDISDTRLIGLDALPVLLVGYRSGREEDVVCTLGAGEGPWRRERGGCCCSPRTLAVLQ